MDRRACQLLGEYRRKVANVDREYYGTVPGEVGPDSSSWLEEGDYRTYWASVLEPMETSALTWTGSSGPYRVWGSVPIQGVGQASL